MRRKRITANQTQETYYHVVSRCVMGIGLLGEKDGQKAFADILRRWSVFSGIDVLTYCVMPNHFHLLVRCPRPAALRETEMLARLASLYGPAAANETRTRWESYRKMNQTAILEQEKERLAVRFGNLSSFMKGLKQAFCIWYRRNHENHEGTIWESKYIETLVEGGAALAAVSAYIDLNPVRANIVADPKDYPYSGYGAAAAGDAFARKGFSLLCAAQSLSHDKATAAYRALLYGDDPAVLTRAAIKAVLEGPNVRNTITLPQLLRCRVRSFSSGFAIGSQQFAARAFDDHRYAFSENRKHPPVGARLCADWHGIGLFATRKLNKAPVSLSSPPAKK
jgi:REP element-mobilizing transposase RayT